MLHNVIKTRVDLPEDKFFRVLNWAGPPWSYKLEWKSHLFKF
jgi:hypothetical protein